MVHQEVSADCRGVRLRRRLAALAAPLAMVLGGCVINAVPSGPPAAASEPAEPVAAPTQRPKQLGLFSDKVKPKTKAASTKRSVNIGVRFSSEVNATVTALQLYRGKKVRGTLHGVLWDASGKRLGTARFESAGTGWQTAQLDVPVPITADTVYVVSYRARGGQYPMTKKGFAKARRSGKLTVARKGGVYRAARSTAFPRTRTTTNYLVDVVASAHEPPQTLPVVGSAALNLPRIAWEGGPEYYRQFSNAQHWAEPSFFPIGIWYNEIATDSEARWDKDHGINFYAGMWEGTDFSVFERNRLYWVGPKLNDTFDETSQFWPADELDDEIDGRFSPEEGLRLIRQQQADKSGKGRFTYANFTQLVIGQHLDRTVQEEYVNTPDTVSLDLYWYTLPFCDWDTYWGTEFADPVPKSRCRTASSYGKAVNGLTIRDSVDGELHPRWMFVENLNGVAGAKHTADITPGQLQGAAMNSVINEARGLVWFNQSFTGGCRTSRALREAQRKGRAFCGHRQMQAMGEVNQLIHSLAPVLNTQSYQWRFGSGLDTMLKSHGGYAYIFAMTDGRAGTRTLKLPPGVTGTAVEVVGEDRNLAVNEGGFSDSFAREYSYHVYRVRI